MTFTIAHTKTTPSAEFKNGNLVVSGKSVPFDNPEIYDVIKDRLTLYFKNPKKLTCIDFNLSAANAISKRYIINTLKLLEQFDESGYDIKINWYYHSDNEDILELGEICKANFNVNFQLKQTD